MIENMHIPIHLLAANGISFFSYLFAIVAGYSRGNTLRWQSYQLITKCISYSILGAWAGVGANLVGIARNGLQRHNKLSVCWRAFLIIFLLLINSFHFQLINLLPVVSVGAYTAFLNSDEDKTKALIIATTIPWIFYCAAVGDFASAILEFLSAAGAAVGIVRLKQQCVKKEGS